MEEKEFLKKVKVIESAIKETLIQKNKKYGNAALVPLNVFYKGTASNSIEIRLDDKLSRILNSKEVRKNDLFDIIGYLILLNISKFNEVSSKDIYFKHGINGAVDWTFEDYVDWSIKMLNIGHYPTWKEYCNWNSGSTDTHFHEIFDMLVYEMKKSGKYTILEARDIAAVCVCYLIENDILNFDDLID